MKKLMLALLILLSVNGFSQADTLKWLRAFPITEYMVELDDSTHVVQLYLPEGPVIKDGQVGLLRGTYQDGRTDTSIIGTGKCHLIKGDYYYFSIRQPNGVRTPAISDILYTMVPPPDVYKGQLVRVASHFIQLESVMSYPFYYRQDIFEEWRESDEKNAIDSIVADIRFTGEYFLTNSPNDDKLIKSGDFKDQKVFYVMVECQQSYVRDFLDYIIARPRLYAGQKWKMSEIFATWLLNGSPKVKK